MPHLMIVVIPYINLSNRSLIIKYLFLRNMEPLIVKTSRKHAYIVLTPLNPTLYGETGVYRVYINFLISAQKHKLWVLVRTASPFGGKILNIF